MLKSHWQFWFERILNEKKERYGGYTMKAVAKKSLYLIGTNLHNAIYDDSCFAIWH